MNPQKPELECSEDFERCGVCNYATSLEGLLYVRMITIYGTTTAKKLFIEEVSKNADILETFEKLQQTVSQACKNAIESQKVPSYKSLEDYVRKFLIRVENAV